ncbi:MAG: DUF6941 family protein [Actinomycetota bacterium]|jgi:hypothetical protein
MRVDYAFVAEAADSQGGLFYVTRGGADLHFLPREFPKPLRLGAISFVVRVLGEPHEIGQTFTLLYSIVDADGRKVGFEQRVEARFEAHPIDPTRATASVVTFRFYGFPVPDFGTYVFEVHHGEDRLAQVPFWVVPVDGTSDAPG